MLAVYYREQLSTPAVGDMRSYRYADTAHLSGPRITEIDAVDDLVAAQRLAIRQSDLDQKVPRDHGIALNTVVPIETRRHLLQTHAIRRDSRGNRSIAPRASASLPVGRLARVVGG